MAMGAYARGPNESLADRLLRQSPNEHSLAV